MKTFIFTKEYKKSTYGSKVTTKVWQIKNNKPVYVGETNYNTQSYRGHDHEAMQVIIGAKLLPLNCMDRPKYGYINRDKQNVVFQLIELC